MRYAPYNEVSKPPKPNLVDQTWHRFLKTGKSGPYRNNGTILADLCNRCVKKKVPFLLQFDPDRGYHLIRNTSTPPESPAPQSE